MIILCFTNPSGSLGFFNILQSINQSQGIKSNLREEFHYHLALIYNYDSIYLCQCIHMPPHIIFISAHPHATPYLYLYQCIHMPPLLLTLIQCIQYDGCPDTRWCQGQEHRLYWYQGQEHMVCLCVCICLMLMTHSLFMFPGWPSEGFTAYARNS